MGLKDWQAGSRGVGLLPPNCLECVVKERCCSCGVWVVILDMKQANGCQIDLDCRVCSTVTQISTEKLECGG